MNMKSAVYPGTFDPVTNGHTDVIGRALKIFDKLHVVVADNPQKAATFSGKERVEMLKEALKKHNGRVEVEYFEGLLLDYVKKKKSNVIVRGLRAISDFEYEFQMALTNRKLAPEIETLFMMPNEIHSYVSSSTVKEVARLGGDISDFVPVTVRRAVEKKIGKPFRKR